MSDSPTSLCVLIVADPPRISGLVNALAEPLPQGMVEVLLSSGGDDTIDLFEARKPHVVVVTATLDMGDSGALIDAMRGMVASKEHVGVVVIGDSTGAYRTALDVAELGADAFVASPVAPKALRFAVGNALDKVKAARGPADRGELRARWEAIADSIAGDVDDVAIGPTDTGDEAAPLPPPIVIRPRRHEPSVDAEVAPPTAWKPGTTADVSAPAREPTLIIRDPEPTGSSPAIAPLASPSSTTSGGTAADATASGNGTSGGTSTTHADARPASRDSTNRIGDSWDRALPLAELLSESSRRLAASSKSTLDEDGILLDDLDDDLGLLDDARGPAAQVDAVPSLVPSAPAPARTGVTPSTPPPLEGGRDFARQLRAKMSQMAQRLFQGGSGPAAQPAVDVGPRHDHSTEIDLSTLGDDVALERGVTEIEARVLAKPSDMRDSVTSPGSWDTQIRERGLPDSGEIVRGLSDAAMLLAKMFAQQSTGRISFRQIGEPGTSGVEKIVYFDQGRPVFASSSDAHDRMGELLVREGKITASQYERCQAVVAESGRRMGEILVGFGYLKRRELLPAVRRHVEDIVYSLFGWDRGTYHIAVDATPSSERIRLSRHPAALVLEGIRRKYDRSTLERLLGPPSTVIEVPDRERLGGIINLGDLAAEERGALAAFDAHADLTTVARAAGVDVADVLPLAWGLCVLGLATARRTDTEVPDETSALVGETDLAIDRERVRARWRLVSEADYFALLGVRRDATAFEIRRAYQAARRDFAADGFPPDLRRELAQELDDIAVVLDEAFRVLRDDRLRLTYLANLID